ncbi:hypothetical protein AYI69_g6143 [Smittium culicis]|uniref:Uncharacterized protein n=1 Tax=Smittium culicis TaxID=133412 RepID=A0A1R1Y0Z0_9FUNG|nr:hypothetical protein AYI69_g6143 [Smittium culicis]
MQLTIPPIPEPETAIPTAAPRYLSNHIAVTDIEHEKTNPDPIPSKKPWVPIKAGTELTNEAEKRPMKEINPPNHATLRIPILETILLDKTPVNSMSAIVVVPIHDTSDGFLLGNATVV